MSSVGKKKSRILVTPSDYKIKLVKSSFFKERATKKALCAFIMKADQFSIGRECASFEKKFSKWQRRKYTVLFNTGSSANLALIQSLLNLGRLKPGMKVGFSGVTWATNVMPLMQLGLKSIPVDVELETLNCSLRTLKAAHKEHKLDAFFITNLLGFADNIDEIETYCAANKILLIEDNCESLGSVVKKKKLGNFSLASTFSFFVGHHMSAIEGGAVCTDDPELDMQLRMVRSHGWDRHLTPSQQKTLRQQHQVTDFYSKYTFYDVAYNLRPTEITGFIGSYQLKFLDTTIKKREKNFKAFLDIYKIADDIYPLKIKMQTISNFAMPIVCKTKEAMDRYRSYCEARGIEVRPIVGGVMADQPFFKKYIKKKFNIPNARLVHNQGFYFANNPELTKSEVAYILKTFKTVAQTQVLNPVTTPSKKKKISSRVVRPSRIKPTTAYIQLPVSLRPWLRIFDFRRLFR